MGKYNNLPTLELSLLKPARAYFHAPGSGIEGAKNGLGQGQTIETTGGGVVMAAIEECFIHDPIQHEYINWVDAVLSGSYRYVNVPIITCWMGPHQNQYGTISPFIGGIPHSDTSVHSDKAGYKQSRVSALATKAANAFSGIIEISVSGATRPMRFSDWFSIDHPTKGNRAYRYWQVLSGDLANPTYKLAISPPLREAIDINTVINFADPTCVMTYPSGFQAPWTLETFHMSKPSFSFVEAP